MANHNLDAERYIVECLRQWAESVVARETSDLERFVADDYVGIDPGGNACNKAELISHTRMAPKQYASTHLNEVKVRFFVTLQSRKRATPKTRNRVGSPSTPFCMTDPQRCASSGC